MGSFNTTCAISKSEIKPGQKAYVFFLIYDSFSTHYDLREKNFFSNSFLGSFCDPCSHFKIIGYPLLGTYEDYNYYKFEDKDLEFLTLASIKKIHYPNKKTDGFFNYNESHDFLDLTEINDMEQLQKIEHSGSLRVQTHHGISFVSKMAIHQRIYEDLILSHQEKSPYCLTKHFTEVNLENLISYFSTKTTSDIDELFNSLSPFDQVMIEITNDSLLSKINQKDDNGFLITNDYILKTREEQIIKAANKIFTDDTFRDHFKFLYSTTIYNSDIFKLDNIRDRITTKISELYIMYLWFKSNNFEFLPTLISDPDYDNDKHSQNLFSIATITHNMNGYFSDEEIPHTHSVEIIKKINVSINDLEKTFLNWFGDEPNKYSVFFDFLYLIKTQKISEFIIGDQSDIDVFFRENNLIGVYDNGTVVSFN